MTVKCLASAPGVAARIGSRQKVGRVSAAAPLLRSSGFAPRGISFGGRKNGMQIRAIISDEPPLRDSMDFPEDDDKMGGNSDLQDELLFMLRVGEGRMRVVQHLDEEGDKMRLRAAKAKMEAEERSKVQLKRFELELGMVSQEIDQKAAEAHDAIQKSKARLKVDERRLSEFEAQLARDRNVGLYFKSLHQPSNPNVLTRMEYLHPLTVRGMHATKVNAVKGSLRASLYGSLGMITLGALVMAIENGHLGAGILNVAILTCMAATISQEQTEVQASEAIVARIDETHGITAAEQAAREIKGLGDQGIQKGKGL